MSLPRVTEIIKAAGLMQIMPYTEHARDRGTAVHAATAFSDLRTLDEDSVGVEIMPYLVQWRKFISDNRVLVRLVEQSVSDEGLGYRGTFDREVEFNESEWLLDIKAGARAEWHGVQLAAYHNAHGKRSLRRGNLYLTQTSYKLVEAKDRNDWPDFKAALRILQRRTQWKLI